MCLVNAWNTGFAVRYVAPKLSRHKVGSDRIPKFTDESLNPHDLSCSSG